MHMMVQRDSLPENVVLQGRYEVRKTTHTTKVERNYEIYDREEKKEYRMKEFYPSNYCGRGADGQMVIVRGTRNRSVFEKAKEEFGQAYRQIAACPKITGIPEVACLFQENNTMYVILVKSKGERLSEELRRAGGKLSYAESVPVIRSIVETLLQIQAPKGCFPKISKESLLLLKKKNKIEIMFTEIVPKEDVIYSLGSLWYEMLTGLCPEMSSIRAPSELGVQLPDEAKQGILRCLKGDTGNRVSLEEILSILPQKTLVRWKMGKKQILPVVAALAVLAAMLSLFFQNDEYGESFAETEPFYVKTSDAEQTVTPSVFQADEPEAVSEGGIQERAASGPVFSVEPVNDQVEKENPQIEENEKFEEESAKGKEKGKKKIRKKTGRKGKKKVHKPAVSKPQNKQESDLFDLW